jgi:AsmA protein
MNKILRNVLIALGIVVVLVVTLPFVVPLDMYRGKIETAAGTATGRAFKIDGPLRLTFFPRFGVRAKEVTLANAPGGRAAVMVAVGDIDLSVKVLPLFTGRIALDKIVLDKPTIALEVDRFGNPNWKFGKESEDEKGAKSKGTLTLPAGTEFSGIEVTDGRVTYDNDKTNTHRALEHVNISVEITTADQPITATGDMTLLDKKLSFTAHLATLQTFLGSGNTTFDLTAEAELVKARIGGVMLPDGTVKGDIALSSPSFRGLADWLGTRLPAGGLNALTLSAKIENKDKITTFDDLNVALDGQTMKGRLMVDARTKIPVLDGALSVDKLNLNPYLSGGKGEEKTPSQSGWSKKPVSVALLKEFNGKLSLTTGALRVQGLSLGRTSLRLENQGGFATVWLDQMALYGGNGKAELTVDARGKVPLFANKLSFSAVQLGPLLKDALGLTSIEGTGGLWLDIRMAGASPNALMHSLSGKGALSGANGRIKGVDLGAVARTVSVAVGGNATGDVAATAFHDMGANFGIANGVVNTSDFHLKGPVVQMTGTGAIDVGNKTIDFRVHPQAAVGGYGIGVPFHITGSWDKLHYAPDVGAMIGNVVDSIKNGGSAIQNLFGIH